MKRHKNSAWAEEVTFGEIQEMYTNFEVEKEDILDSAFEALNKFTQRESRRGKEPKIKKKNQCWN